MLINPVKVPFSGFAILFKIISAHSGELSVDLKGHNFMDYKIPLKNPISSYEYPSMTRQLLEFYMNVTFRCDSFKQRCVARQSTV